MTKLDDLARKIFPRLRMQINGSEQVNWMRARTNETIISTWIAPEKVEQSAREKFRIVEEEPKALGARETAGEFGKRKKIKQLGYSKSAFANVLIEVSRASTGGTGLNESALRDKLYEKLAKELKRTKEFRAVGGALLKQRNFIFATLPLERINHLKQEPGVAFVHAMDRIKFDIPLPENVPNAQQVPTPRGVPGHTGEGVLIGIIDVGGFDFAHPDFLDAQGKTRFVAIWDQGGDNRAPPASFEKGVPLVGAEITRAHMNAAIAAAKAKAAGLPAVRLEPQSQMAPNSHGTHVASIAAGNRGVCPKAEIAGVLISLPNPANDKNSRRTTFSDSGRILEAVQYLVRLAEQRKKPLSINISLGTNGGAHDGSAGVLRWIDALLATPGRAICAAAGNAGQEKVKSATDYGWLIGRIHSSGRVAAKGLDVDLEWIVSADNIEDLSENEMEIWYGSQDRFRVSVKPPGRTAWIECDPRRFVENRRLADGTMVSIYNELYHPVNGANYAAIYLSPHLDPNNLRGVRPGKWTVRLHGVDVRDGRFDAWIERDDPRPIGQNVATQLWAFPSTFSEASNVDSHSISSLACGHRVIAVANMESDSQTINVSSSQGPTRDGRLKPEIAAPGTSIVAAAGFSRDGQTWASMTGTSMASPFVAGAVGLMLAKKNNLTAAQCIGILQRTSRPLPGASYEWKNDAGFGAIDIVAAIAEADLLDKREGG